MVQTRATSTSTCRKSRQSELWICDSRAAPPRSTRFPTTRVLTLSNGIPESYTSVAESAIVDEAETVTRFDCVFILVYLSELACRISAALNYASQFGRP